jgi:lipopolysaccharide transport system ATP-binding protein
MGDVAKEGRTVLFVSHNMAAIQQLCPSSLLIRKGSMEKIGPSLDVINNYLDESGDSSQFVDLLKTQRPVKNKIVKFSSVQIVNKDLLATNGFMMGDDLVVRFQIKWLDQNFSQKIHIAIIIKTSDGIPIANCLNMDSGFKLENLSGTYEVNFKDNLLYPGQYHISLWAGLDRIETYDYVQNIISFNIIGGGLKTTRDLLRTDGIFYFTPSWKKID